MEECIIMLLPIVEKIEQCSVKTYHELYNLYNYVIKNIRNKRDNSYDVKSQKLNRSYSDSNIKYSDDSNPNSWEMLQIRLV